ncbi:MAG: vanadium-dependent haloperoxidase [Saprospiraceae bacterium]|nr:vanadium-dependent haloperoxidase [Saprospiraceae bacterium]
MNRTLKSFIGLFILTIFISSCKKDIVSGDETTTLKNVSDYNNDVIFEWNETFLAVEKYAAGYRPGPAPRAVAYLGLSAYEASISGMPDFNSFNQYWSGFNIPVADANKEYCWPLVINASYDYLMPKFFVKANAENQELMANTAKRFYEKYKSEVPQEVYDRSVLRGKDVAEAVWNWSKTDAVGHDHYLDPFQGYDWTTKYKKDGDWLPTVPGPGKPMGGVWGKARTLAIKEDLRVCRPPIVYSADSKSHLYAQAVEVYAQNTPTLSYEGEWIGEFWSDDLVGLTFSPGVRFLAIGNQVLKLEKSNLETAVFMTALVGVSSNDAGIACWNSKYYYNVERPESYIKRVIDPTWEPALYNPLTGDAGISPSFPAYPSGHSTMGAAGAEALGYIFGYNYSMTDNCHKNATGFEGTPRTFSSFEEMANENGWSRVPLGVHFRMDCEEGVRYGKEIGRATHNLPWKK